jgi:hypothetical protein
MHTGAHAPRAHTRTHDASLRAPPPPLSCRCAHSRVVCTCTCPSPGHFSRSLSRSLPLHRSLIPFPPISTPSHANTQMVAFRHDPAAMVRWACALDLAIARPLTHSRTLVRTHSLGRRLTRERWQSARAPVRAARSRRSRTRSSPFGVCAREWPETRNANTHTLTHTRTHTTDTGF